MLDTQPVYNPDTQAMLALFTDRARAEQVMPGMGEFRHPVEVDSQWAILLFACLYQAVARVCPALVVGLRCASPALLPTLPVSTMNNNCMGAHTLNRLRYSHVKCVSAAPL